MEINLRGVDIESLKTMLQDEETVLKTALLQGKSWNEMAEQRHKVTQLAIAIHKRMYPLIELNPAEFVRRENYIDEYPRIPFEKQG